MEEEVNPASARSEQSYHHRVPAAPVVRAEHRESSVTRLVEQQAAKLPSNVFLFAAVASMGVSLAAELTGRQRLSRFVGMWPGPLLIMGVYNKLVKTFGPM